MDGLLYRSCHKICETWQEDLSTFGIQLQIGFVLTGPGQDVLPRETYRVTLSQKEIDAQVL